MTTITIAIVGSGGTGVVALGDMLLQIAAVQGLYGMMRKTFSPQIRGGEAASIVRLGYKEVASFDAQIDLLLVLDWNNFQRFSDEIVIDNETVIVQDSQAGEAPQCDQPIISVGFLEAASSLDSSYANVAALGYLARWLNCKADIPQQAMVKRLHLSEAEMETVFRVADLGAQAFSDTPLPLQILQQETDVSDHQDRWLATGNQMAALGALEAGVRFVAAYPITPASDALEWLAGHIEDLGGHLVQAEDELAAVNMAIGAAYGGVPAFTATSGPGMALMAESMGLAVASEIPLVVLDVMRGGPSTGIPTKSEQTDLNLAIYGLHGDAPHVVLSPLSVPDCCNTVAWAVQLAAELQTLVIVLSDQFLGQSTQIFPPLPPTQHKAHLLQAHLDSKTDQEQPYYRYLDTESGVSPMVLPGEAGGMYTADGLEHNEKAVPSPRAKDHQQQLEKRQRKLLAKDYGHDWASFSDIGEGASFALLCWGSLFKTACEAQSQLRQQGIEVDVIGLRLLMPLQTDALQTRLRRYEKVLVVEQSHQQQFKHYLQSFAMDVGPLLSLARPGPSLITPAEICQRVMEVVGHEA